MPTTDITVPRTAAEVVVLLKKLKFSPPDREGLEAISRAEGGKFAEVLASLQDPKGVPDSQRDYVQSVLTAALPITRDVIVQAGYGADPVLLIDIAKREGRAFRNALRLVASSADRNERGSALEYLRGVLEEYGCAPLVDPEQMQFPSSGIDESNDWPAAPPESVERERSQPPEEHRGANTSQHPEPKRQFGASCHVYGGRGVVCISETTTPNSSKATISFEVAQRTPDGKAQWQDKIALMLSIPEQTLCLGVLLGYMERLEIKGHGAQMEKALTIVNQGNQFFLTMISRGQAPRAVPIPPEHSYPIVTMLMGQMRKNDPHMTVDLILRMTKRICEMRCAARVETGGVRG